MSNDSAVLGNVGLWSSIIGVVLPGCLAGFLFFLDTNTSEQSLSTGYLICGFVICGFLFVILELVALVCGIAARRTTGGNPDKIVASGGSAGGHIAACTTLIPASELKDEKVSCKANALLLFNPVLRFGPQMLKRVDNDEAVGKAISPVLYLAKDSPPTLLFFGTDDFLYKQGEEFMQRSKELGHRAEMFTAEKQPHGYFNKSPWREKTLKRADEFLVSLGYLQGKPTIKIPDAKEAQPKGR